MKFRKPNPAYKFNGLERCPRHPRRRVTARVQHLGHFDEFLCAECEAAVKAMLAQKGRS
jgi:hypothetical protein